MYGRFPVLHGVREALCLLAAASFFDVALLCEVCESFILTNLTAENLQECCNFFHKFYYGRYGESILKASKALLLRQANKSAQLVAGLPFSIIEEVLSSDSLCVLTEYDRYNLIKEVMAKLDAEEKKRMSAWIASSLVEEIIEEVLDDSEEEKDPQGEDESRSKARRSPKKLSDARRTAQEGSSTSLIATLASAGQGAPGEPHDYSSGGEESQDCEETDDHQSQQTRALRDDGATANGNGRGEDALTPDDDRTATRDRRQARGKAKAPTGAAASSTTKGRKLAESEPSSEKPENNQHKDPAGAKATSLQVPLSLDPEDGLVEQDVDLSLEQLKAKLLESIHFSSFSVQELFKARGESFVPPATLTEALWRKEYVRTKIMQIQLEPETDPKLACEFFRLCRFFPKDACTISGLNFCEPFAAFGSMWKVSAKVVKDNDKKFVACFLYRQRADPTNEGQLHFCDSQPSRYYEFSISILTSAGVIRKSSCRKFANDGNADNCNWGWNKFLKFSNVEEVMNANQLIISVKLRPVL